MVAPLTLIVPGVLNGSQGSLFYSAAEIAKSTDSWNAMPLTLQHPQNNDGQSVSGRTPAINEKQGIGTVYNAKIVDGSLVAEGWFDIEATRDIAPRVAEALEANQPIELSTGLFTDNVKAPKGSDFQGTPFTARATNLRPDHLAILMDQTGACSLEDGCGVLNKGTMNDQSKGLSETLSDNATSDTETTTLFSSEKKGGKMPLTKNQKTELVGELVKNCEYCDESDTAILNELSDEKLLARQTDMKQRILQNSIVEAVQAYAGETVEPEQLAEFVVNAAKKNQAADEDEEEILRKKKLALLEKNKKHGTEENDKGGEDVSTNKTKPKTDEEWLSEAPEHLQNTWRYAQEIEAREKEHIVSRIVANVEDDKQKTVLVNRLKDKDLAELRDLAILAPQAKEEERLPVSFMGAQGAPVANQDNFDENDTLETPTINWAEDN